MSTNIDVNFGKNIFTDKGEPENGTPSSHASQLISLNGIENIDSHNLYIDAPNSFNIKILLQLRIKKYMVKITKNRHAELLKNNNSKNRTIRTVQTMIFEIAFHVRQKFINVR